MASIGNKQLIRLMFLSYPVEKHIHTDRHTYTVHTNADEENITSSQK
jgi:putative NIF3 family GTP cyclohydrolase 1 type 2